MLSLKIKDFINKVQDNVLIPELEKTVSRQVSSKEKTYWERSYTELSRLFNSLVERMPSFADVHIILEYNLPLASKYCDVILCGEKAGRRCCLVMELKHWDRNSTDQPTPIEGVLMRGGKSTLHPSLQLKGYVEYLQNFHSAFTLSKADNICVGCVFFTTDIDVLPYQIEVNKQLAEDYPLFSLNQQEKLKEYILNVIEKPAEEFAESVISGQYMQNRATLANFEAQFQTAFNHGQESRLPYVLLDEQNLGFNQIIHVLQQVIDNHANQKQVIIVSGNPGSGKSAVAINAFFKALNIAESRKVSGNISLCTTSDAQNKPWTTIFKKSGLKGAENTLIKASKFSPGISSNKINEMVRVTHEILKRDDLLIAEKDHYRFNPLCWREIVQLLEAGAFAKYGISYNDPGEFLLVLVDEAHGLLQPIEESSPEHVMEISIGQKDIPPVNGPMSYHIIKHSQISVFFIDEQQAYRDKEGTRIEHIEQYAEELNACVTKIDLNGAEYRCGGSQEYIEWVRNIFTQPYAIGARSFGNNFTLKVVDSLRELETSLRQCLNDKHTARYVSNYSVEWKTRKYASDPCIHSFPPEKQDFFLADPDGFQFVKTWNTDDFIAPRLGSPMHQDPLLEVGYPLTIRGFDFDYIGVLWLNDLIVRDGKWLISIKNTSYDKGPSSKRRAAVEEAKKKGLFISLTGDALHWGKKGEYITPLSDAPAINRYCQVVFSNYLVLLTRAIKGNIIYIKDPETRQYIKHLLSQK